MIFHSFTEVEEHILAEHICPRLVLANAQDDDALGAVVHAKRKGVIRPILIGSTDEISGLLEEMGESKEDYLILSAEEENEAAQKAMEMIVHGEADIPMKGIMQTSSFMRAILHKEYGFFEEGSLLSQATVLEWPEKNKLLFIGDCAVNISPDLEQKKKILQNTVRLSHSFGLEKPKVAVLSALEKVNPKILSSVHAAELSRMEWEDCVVYGPLALDNAISKEAAKHKGIEHEVAGEADVLLVPDLPSGNIFTKSLTFFAHLKSSGALCGGKIPAVMTSRTDTSENKYNSILTAILQRCVV